MTTNPFRGRTVALLVGVMSVSFVFTVLLIVFGEEFAESRSARADSTSYSALGHRAFVEVLKAAGVPVVVSRFDAERRDGASALLVVAEPDLQDNAQPRVAALRRMIEREGWVLLVLPKWKGTPDPDHPGWVESASLLPEEEVTDVLNVLVQGPTVVRVEPAERRRWGTDDITVAPTIRSTTQLIRTAGTWIYPVVTTADGILVGMVERRNPQTSFVHRTYVLSDPDVLSTHGIVRGENAQFAAELVDIARGSKETVVVDETLHGIAATQNLWREMFRFPLVLVVIQALLAALVLLWAATGRFGAPVPEAAALAAGKAFLVDNTADLLHFGGHATGALQRYFKATVQDVARATHVPAGLPKEEVVEWLERAGASRSVTVEYQDLAAAVAEPSEAPAREARRVVDVASRIHRWRKEMIDGSSVDS